jgi:GNAT superfamily N-acetyltransferase
VNILPFTVSDVPALAPLQPAGWRDLAVPFRAYLSWPFCTPVKAVSAGQVIGVGAAILFSRTGWLGHVIVSPRHRRRGVGSAITAHLVDNLLQAGCETISLVATDEGCPVYLRAGFEVQETYVLFRPPKRRVAERPGEPPACLEPATERDMRGILDIDAEVSGEARAALFGGPALPAGRRLFVCRDGSRLTGFADLDLGDGLVLALTESAGRALLALRIASAERLGMPVSNKVSRETASRAGFRRSRSATRMVLGRPFSWRPECIYNRIGGNLG